jgi:hypothetical protein
LAGAGVLCITSVTLARAEVALPSWDFEPGIRLSALYDDNVRLSRIDPEGSFGGIISAYALASQRTEVRDLSFRATVDSRLYTDISELDSTDGSVEFDYGYRFDRGEVGLFSSFVYDSTQISEEETTGLVQINQRRKRFEIRPSGQYLISERARVGADVSLQDVSYEDVDDDVLSDYQFMRIGLNGGYDLNERMEMLGRLTHDRYDSEDSDRSESLGGELGVRYQLSERTVLNALAGVQSVKASSDDIDDGDDDRSTGPIFEVGFQRDYQPGLVRVLLQRSLLPSGRGTLLDTTRANLFISRPITERWTARLAVNAGRNRNPDGSTNFNDRDFVTVSPGLRWRVGESSSLDLSYRFRWQEYDVLSGDAMSNAVFLAFVHDWTAR